MSNKPVSASVDYRGPAPSCSFCRLSDRKPSNSQINNVMFRLRTALCGMLSLLVGLRLGRISSFSQSNQVPSTTRRRLTQQTTPITPYYFPIFYNDVYQVTLPPNHRFPMQKYQRTRERIQSSLRKRRQNLLPSQRSLVETDFIVSPLASVAELETTHCPDYIQRYLTGDLTDQELRNVGFPWNHEGVKRSLSSTGGTVAAAVTVMEAEHKRRRHGMAGPTALAPWSAHVAGGTHHAFYDRGEGFCVFSDIAVAANVVLDRYPSRVRRILILDLDVHQGNGNAVLFQNDPRVFTFSIHCEKNYFSPKERSDLDIELPEGCNDITYLSTLSHWLKRLKTEMGTDFSLIFYQAGVDVLDHDRLGRMSLTLDGVRKRNEMVYQFSKDLDVPLVITMGGGYPRTNDWEPILEAHASVYLQAHAFLEEALKASI